MELCGADGSGKAEACTPYDVLAYMHRWLVARDAESARKVAEERFPGKLQNLVQVGIKI